MVVLFVLLLPPAASYPTYIGCNLQVMPGKPGAGRNLMTTTGSIMGATPTNDANLVSTSVSGSTILLTFSGAFSLGIAHASIGTFTAPQFSGTADASAARCAGTQSIIYKDVSGTTNSIVWQLPAQVGTATSATLSFAAASGYGAISRHTITFALSNAPGTTATPTATLTTPPPSGTSSVTTATPPPTVTQPVGSGQYTKINTGNCISNQLDPINDIEACQIAARALQLPNRNATTTSATPLPEGCYYAGNRLFLAVNPANIGNGAATGYQQLCAAKPATVAPTPAPGQNNGSLADPDRFRKVTTGNCISNQMSTISDLATCEAAAQAFQLADTTATVSSDTPRPPGCFLMSVGNGNIIELYLSTNPANAPYGAAPGYELLCENVAPNVASASATDNPAMIGGIAGGALLLCLAMSCCMYRSRCRAKTFEA
jgi:hypothetical protein